MTHSGRIDPRPFARLWGFGLGDGAYSRNPLDAHTNADPSANTKAGGTSVGHDCDVGRSRLRGGHKLLSMENDSILPSNRHWNARHLGRDVNALG